MKVRPRLRQPGQAGGAETMKKATTSAKAPQNAVSPASKPRKPKAARLAAPIPELPGLDGRRARHRSGPRRRLGGRLRGLASRGRPGRTPRAGARGPGGQGRSAGPARPPAARRARALHHGPVADVALAGLRRLGVACAGFAGQAAAACAKGVSQGRAFRRPMPPPR